MTRIVIFAIWGPMETTPLVKKKLHPIKAFRVEYQLTQKELADLIGYKDGQAIGLVERGINPCSRRLANAMEKVSKGKLKAKRLLVLDPAQFKEN